MSNKFSFLIAIAWAGILLVSCQNTETIHISGELAGGGQDTLIFTNRISENTYKIAVNDSGVFSGELNGAPGYYRLRSQSQQMLPGIPLYLPKGKTISLTVETKDWRKNQNYTVLNNPESEYLRDFNRGNIQLYRKYKYNLGKLNPVELELVVDSLRAVQNNLLEQFIAENPKTDDEFIQVERERIRYNYAEFKESYALRNRRFTLPDNFFDFRKELDYNDEKLLAISGLDYGMAVNRFVNNEARRTLPEDGDLILQTINTCVQHISNQKVKNYLLTTLVAPYLKTSENYEEAYALFVENCTDEHYLNIAQEKFETYQKTKKGNPSPRFADYQNHAGGTRSLDDFKGKYVYIDVWATWCVPCRKEIPALKKLEKAFHGKNIEFVSVSIDSDKELWQKTVEEEQLGGVQLIADNAGQSQFLKDYDITSIPRFILIGPDGEIIDAAAPKPSEPATEALLLEALRKGTVD